MRRISTLSKAILSKVSARSCVFAAVLLVSCIPGDDIVYAVEPGASWTGRTPCNSDIFAEYPRLPGGAVQVASPTGRGRMYEVRPTPGRTDGAQDGTATGVGGRVYISGPQVRFMPVEGRKLSHVLDYLETHDPLGEITGLREEGATVLAYIYYDFEAVIAPESTRTNSPGWGDREVSIGPWREDLTVVMPAYVQLLRWTGYDRASEADRLSWDRMQCQSIHHELGHMFISAQSAADAMENLRGLRAASEQGLRQALDEALDRVREEADTRNDLYHEEIAAMGWEVAGSAPFFDMPYSDAVLFGARAEAADGVSVPDMEAEAE